MPAKRLSVNDINNRMPCNSLLKAVEIYNNHTSKSGFNKSRAKCECKCGNYCYVIVTDVLRGNPLSCGCIKRGTKKRIVNKKLHKVWYDMHLRCNDVNNKHYKDVEVCEEWLDYTSFYNWAIKNNYKDGLQLDKDIKGNGLLYSPDTCCFVTVYDNVCNRSNSKKYLFDNKMLTLSQISKITGVNYILLKSRIYAIKKTLLKIATH